MFNKDFDPLAELENLKVISHNNHQCIGHMIEVYKQQARAYENLALMNKLLTDKLNKVEQRVIELEEVLACLYKE